MAEEVVVRLADDQFERLIQAIQLADPFYIPELPPYPRPERPPRSVPPVMSIPRWASGQAY